MMINKNKQGGFSFFAIVVFVCIITLYLLFLGIAISDIEKNRTPSERIESINEQYLNIVEYINKTQYITPQYLDSLKSQINQFDSEINKLKTKINDSKNNNDLFEKVKSEVLSEVSSLDNKLIELNQIYKKQNDSIAKTKSEK